MKSPMDELFDALDSGATLLTPNRRLTRTLTEAYGAQRRAAGEQTWKTPDILPWSSWLQRCLGEASQDLALTGQPAPNLLTPLQERILWEQVIRGAGEEYALLQPAGAARLVQEAWGLLHGWQLDLQQGEFALSEDTLAFYRWAQAYMQRCREANWLDGARLASWLQTCLQQNHLKPPQRLLLIGFEELTPQQQTLLETLRQRGGQVKTIEPQPLSGRAVRIGMAHAREEVRLAAWWARYCLENKPAARVGIVVPDLQHRQSRLRRELDAALEPERLLACAPPTSSLYNLSLGRPLSDYPLVHDALLILQSVLEPLSWTELGTLLRSPFLAGGLRESDNRALLDARVRQWGALTIDWNQVMQFAEPDCPLLTQALKGFQERVRALPRQTWPGGWAGQFSRLLEALGWPGERMLSSEEFQTGQAWQGLLEELGSLDGLLGPVSLREIWPRLRGLAAETVFQPRSPAAPVQVLGILEAAGLSFDYLWVMGLHDEAWPPAPQPNPFLPPGLQRRHGLPRSCGERELTMASRLTRRLLTAAPDIVISHPCLEGERELRPSPLIGAIPCISSLDLPQMEDYAHLLYAHRRLETWQETHGPAVDQVQVQGGSALLQAQAACPFRAFATYRLGARPLATPQAGLDPLARGTLAHAALGRLWTDADSSLLSLDEAALAERIRQASEQALDHHRAPLGARLKALETERLAALTGEWLIYERQRPGPFSVQVEATQTLCLGGLELSLRIDRVDTLADGRVAIIDYKTGASRPGDWEGERPRAPQLPLYALTQEPDRIAAVAFARVRTGAVKFIGLAPGGLLPDVAGEFQELTWPALIQDWQAALTRLAEDYRQGRAEVDPLESATCEYCALAPLCRIHEKGRHHEA